MNLKNILQKSINTLLSLLFPIECIGCNKEDVYLCNGCFNKIKVKTKTKPFEHPLTYLDGVFSAAGYKDKPLQSAIHLLKFRFIKTLAKPLAQLLIKFYQKSLVTSGLSLVPIIIPVPLNKKRYLDRGFNQSELIAQPFAKHFNLELAADVVTRRKNTPHQVGLTKKKRQQNIKNAFMVNKPNLIMDKEIILIDDVVTTGSTLEEVAKVLKNSGAKKVWGLTIAKD